MTDWERKNDGVGKMTGWGGKMRELEYYGAGWKMTGLGGRRKKMTGGVKDIGVGDDRGR